MAANAGPDIIEDGIVFYYDTGNTVKSYIGQPSTNYWDAVQYSIYNDNATNYRNQASPPPPIPGYEVVKVVSNTQGTYSHSILWKAPYPNNNVSTITNSIYAWLQSGSYVQVGQHWYPWYYGTQKNIPVGEWVRISETYVINEGNSYGVAALTYSTDGTAYFAIPQYEYTSYPSPFLPANGTRSVTEGLKDLTGNSTVDLTNVSFNGSGEVVFDGTNDYINVPYNSTQNLTNQGTVSVWIYPFLTTQGSFAGLVAQCTGGSVNTQAYQLSWRQISGAMYGAICNGSGTYNEIYGTLPTVANTWYNIVFTWNGSQLNMYNNGTLIGTTTQTINNQVLTTDLTIGGYTYKGAGGAGEYFNGKIANVEIYNRGLTASEVSTNYNALKTRFGI